MCKLSRWDTSCQGTAGWTRLGWLKVSCLGTRAPEFHLGEDLSQADDVMCLTGHSEVAGGRWESL
jgi:hypothetical protein